ncbi:PREDICTED: stromelysin-1-like [Elephantulus edwardii]|uniref:stromelysin-1-like n=1 Tax=Elephantulus edwardii TaxID=28737 RepID=UPI0003F06ACE|nr:PREDICTED: stromelysin-1-like [Elephantulus edwardii]
MKYLIIFVLLCLPVCLAYPLDKTMKKDSNLNFAQKYLENYYNFGIEMKNFVRRNDGSPVVNQIQEMQRFLGLKVTGKLDSATLEVMHKPRCGVPDVGHFTTFPGSPKWRKTHLTYRIVNYTMDMSKYATDSAIVRALKLWEEVTPLTFSRIYEGEADIMISFAVRDHKDFYPFDGPGFSLAHAYPPGPGINGDIHFDDDEQWTEDYLGTNLYLVAAHEVGHSLGLFHSNNPDALMYSLYKEPTDLTHFHLSQDDVNSIQSLYGPPPSFSDITMVPTEPIPPKSKKPDMCDPELSFDAVSTLRGETLFFKDRYFWRKIRLDQKPQIVLISAFWPSLPSELDAAYEVNSKDTVFVFKGNQFWATKGSKMEAGYPRSIHTLGFPPTVKKIDAAFSDKENSKTYFFVGKKYWRFDENSQSMDKGFPRLITENFPGVVPKIDAVFQEFGFFYFFSGSSQFEFDPNAKMVTQKLKTNSWLGC